MSILYLTVLGAGIATAISASKSHRFSWDRTKHILAFGDSYSYVQGTNGIPGFSFIGGLLPEQYAYTPGDILGNKIIQNFTGTAEGGPNWLEFISGCAVEDGLWSPQNCKRQLWDFAVAGADVSEEFTRPHHIFTTPLINQTAEYLEYGDKVLRQNTGLEPDRTLVSLWIGINDISDTYNYANLTAYNVNTWPELYDLIISAEFDLSVTGLLNAGYRHFLFLNLPPLDRAPNVVNTTKQASFKSRINAWNSVLTHHINRFQETYPMATVLSYDVNYVLNQVLDHPLRYGILNTTDYCPGYANSTILTDPAASGCLPLNELFWYNSGHLCVSPLLVSIALATFPLIQVAPKEQATRTRFSPSLSWNF